MKPVVLWMKIKNTYDPSDGALKQGIHTLSYKRDASDGLKYIP